MSKNKAQEIVTWTSEKREELLALHRSEHQLINYYNAGEIPGKEGDSIMSLGLGYRYIKKSTDQMLSIMYSDPGPMKSNLICGGDFERKRYIEKAWDEVANREIKKEYKSLIPSLAGRSSVIGKCFAFRKNPMDLKFERARVLHDVDSTMDIHSDSWWRWSVLGKMRLRDLESLIQKSQGKESEKKGWSREGLLALKKYILEEDLNKNKTQGEDMVYLTADQCEDMPIGEELLDEPLEVIWHFEKSEEKNECGDRKINFYVVSRYQDPSKMQGKVVNGPNAHKMRVKMPSVGQAYSDHQKILFRFDNYFDSVSECLVSVVVDSSLSGNDKMAEVEGLGKQAFPKFLHMESLTKSLLEGAAWASSPNFYIQPGANKQAMKNLAKQGMAPFQMIPEQVVPMNKSNVMSSVGQNIGLIQSMGLDIAQDAQTGEVPVSGGKGVDFNRKSLSDQFVLDRQRGAQQKMVAWMYALDPMWEEIGKTLTKSPKLWNKSDPGYYVAKRIHECLRDHYNIKDSEWEWSPKGKNKKPILQFSQRRVDGGVDDSQSYQKAVTMLQSSDSPRIREIAEKRMVNAIWGPKGVDEAYGEEKEAVDLKDKAIAIQRINSAMVGSPILPPEPADNPEAHIECAFATLQKTFQCAQSLGNKLSPETLKGVQEVMKIAALYASRLSEKDQAAVMGQIQRIAQEFGKIEPIIQVQSVDDQKKQIDMQAKIQDGQVKQAMAQSIIQKRQDDTELSRAKAMFEQNKEVRALVREEARSDAQASSMREGARLSAVKADQIESQLTEEAIDDPLFTP